MSTLSERQASRDPIEARTEPKDTAAQIDDVLQHLDVLSSKAEKYIFKYAYLYYISFFLLDSLLIVIVDSLRGYPDLVGAGIVGNSSLLLVVIGISLILWTFNVWRRSLPKTLRDLREKKRIYALTGDVDISYLGLLEHYRDAISNPRRYLLMGILMISMAIYDYYDLYLLSIKPLFASHPDTIGITFTVVSTLLITLIQFGFMYCLGILAWKLYISGQCIRRFSQVFEFRIEPAHPDHCGGLKALGNFCFGLISPIFIGSAFFIGYIFIYIFIFQPSSNVDVLATIGIILFIILLYGLPIAICAFFLPLWDIHIKMLGEREADEENYAAGIETLRKQIQVLLDNNQLEEAKTVKEKKELMEALHSPYPTWPFNIRTKLFSALIGAGGSLLLSFLGGLEQPLLKFLKLIP